MIWSWLSLHPHLLWPKSLLRASEIQTACNSLNVSLYSWLLTLYNLFFCLKCSFPLYSHTPTLTTYSLRLSSMLFLLKQKKSPLPYICKDLTIFLLWFPIIFFIPPLALNTLLLVYISNFLMLFEHHGMHVCVCMLGYIL